MIAIPDGKTKENPTARVPEKQQVCVISFT